MYVKKNINFISIPANYKNVCIAHLLDFNLFVVVIYRPPSYTHTDNVQLVQFLENFCLAKEVLILGDFNLPDIPWHRSDAMINNYPPLCNLFMECFISLSFNQWMTSPTFLPSGNILDLILTSENDRVGDVKVLPNFSNCGHSPFILQYYFENSIEVNYTHQVKYAWHRGKYDRINSVLLDVDWDFEFRDMSIDDMFAKLQSILSPLIVQYVPILHDRPYQPRQRPPNILKSNRRNAWLTYKHNRSVYGRHSQQTHLALEEFNAVNHLFRNYHVTQQILSVNSYQ